MANVKDRIERAISECLHANGITLESCSHGIYRCSDFRAEGPGVYVFFDDKNVYYVGEASDLKRRVLNEHCKARIGGSEGVVRFLMYFLGEICEKKEEWLNLDAKGREELVRGILREKIGEMMVFVFTCGELNDPKGRKELEGCLIEELRPVLQ